MHRRIVVCLLFLVCVRFFFAMAAEINLTRIHRLQLALGVIMQITANNFAFAVINNNLLYFIKERKIHVKR